jgi:hypothetical protein
MENIDKFVDAIVEDNYSINSWYMCCKFKDGLINYKYKPRLNSANQVIHEWEHSYKEKTLTVDHMRKILIDEVFERLAEMQIATLAEQNKCDSTSDEHVQIQQKIKAISGLCVWVNNGKLFRAFIDNYRLGYFN